MKRSIVVHRSRWRRALAAGSIVTIWAYIVFPTIGLAVTVVTYKDKFLSISFAGSDGTALWTGPWSEVGESNGPSNGAVQVENDSHCASGNCLQIGAEDPDDAGATRTFDSNSATSIVVTFDYVRHVTSSGSGSGGAGVLKMLASANGANWSLIDTFPMNVDDMSPNAASYDLTSFSGTSSAIRFELFGGVDDGHISIDNVVITVTGGSGPTTTTTSSTTSTSTTSSSTTSTSAPTTTTTTTPTPTTSTTSPTTTTTKPAPPSTTTTSSPRTTTTTVAVVTTNPQTTSTAARPVGTTAPSPQSTTTSISTSTTTSTTAPRTTTTEAGAMPFLPDEPPAAFTPAEAREAKEHLVVEIPSVDLSGGQARPEYRLDPREGLSVSYATAVETLKGNLLNSVLLGVTISILLLLGIDRREEPSSLRSSHA